MSLSLLVLQKSLFAFFISVLQVPRCSLKCPNALAVSIFLHSGFHQTNLFIFQWGLMFGGYVVFINVIVVVWGEHANTTILHSNSVVPWWHSGLRQRNVRLQF